MDAIRRQAISATQGVLESLVEMELVTVTVHLDGLPRWKYDALRNGETDSRTRKLWWFCDKGLGGNVKWELSTSEAPPQQLRVVS